MTECLTRGSFFSINRLSVFCELVLVWCWTSYPWGESFWHLHSYEQCSIQLGTQSSFQDIWPKIMQVAMVELLHCLYKWRSWEGTCSSRHRQSWNWTQVELPSCSCVLQRPFDYRMLIFASWCHHATFSSFGPSALPSYFFPFLGILSTHLSPFNLFIPCPNLCCSNLCLTTYIAASSNIGI